MKKFFVLFFLIQTLLSACALDTIDMYKDEIHELTQDPKSRKLPKDDDNINDLSRCESLIEMSRWQLRKKGNYGRNQDWIKGTMITGTGISLDFDPIQNSTYFSKQNSTYFIYIGPWHYSPRIQKQIRFFAYYPKEGGDIQYQYESMTDENKNIPEKNFSLSPTAKYAPDRFGLCVVKWTAKYGYNAISGVKSKNPFSKNYLVPSGRIIEIKE